MRRIVFHLLAAFLAGTSVLPAATSRLVCAGPEGKLVYQPWSQEGDIIPDFSNCGYGGGGVKIPLAPVKLTLQPDATGGDDTARIQKAIDALSKLPSDVNGLRGALLLAKGTYHISGALRIGESGVVLLGEGQGRDGTVLLATGRKSRTLISLQGSSDLRSIRDTKQRVTSNYVPVGARSFEVEDGAKFKVGDGVIVSCIGNAAWIHAIGMDRIQPRPSNPTSTKQWKPFNLDFDRVITAIVGNRITVDAPLGCAIDAQWGGGEIWQVTDLRIQQVGVENLHGESEFDPSVTKEERGQRYFADENHARQLVEFKNVKNAWARDLTAIHFYHGVSSISGGVKWVTVRDCASLEPVSEITGGRRYPFSISGQLCLVMRCFSDEDRHAFAVGSRVPGPNVFLDCRSEHAHATSEPHHRWSCGGLFDNVRANIAFQDRQWMGTGHGWAGANYVAWNCEGSLVCQQPPTAQNFAIGQVGQKLPGVFKRTEGHWESAGQHVEPRSLYLKQLEDRLGPQAVQRIAK